MWHLMTARDRLENNIRRQSQRTAVACRQQRQTEVDSPSLEHQLASTSDWIGACARSAKLRYQTPGSPPGTRATVYVVPFTTQIDRMDAGPARSFLREIDSTCRSWHVSLMAPAGMGTSCRQARKQLGLIVRWLPLGPLTPTECRWTLDDALVYSDPCEWSGTSSPRQPKCSD